MAAPLAAMVALAVALLAWRARALTAGGAAAATVVGTVVLVGTGWAGGAVLAAFFVFSSAVGRIAAGPVAAERRAPVPVPGVALSQATRQAFAPAGSSAAGHSNDSNPVDIPGATDAKGERRDLRQVVANGGPAALAAALGPWFPGLAFWIVTASLAAAAADTWATSIGGLSRRPPRRLLLGPVVMPGANGGMTVLGTAAAAVGALLVSGVGAAAAGMPRLAAAGTLVGFAGMAADSVLGARWQGRFRCPECAVETEWRRHRCGTRTTPMGGLAWLDNDGVNLAATSLAAALGAAAWRVWSP